jgi:hypothetical protein
MPSGVLWNLLVLFMPWISAILFDVLIHLGGFLDKPG